MGPMLDIYLLTQQLEPFVQIGTRAAFFTLVNTIKLVLCAIRRFHRDAFCA